MIISKIITLKTFGNRKLDYFFNLGYDVSGDTFSVKVEDLNSGSRQIIEAECDFCKRIVNVSYKEYLRNISGDINKYACSKLCGSKKAEEKNLKIHGISHPMKLKKVQDKIKRTNLERYGVEYLMQSSEIKNKSKETLIKRWGTSHISKTEHFKNKFKETCLQNNGVEYPMMSEDIREKSKSTLVDNYGVDNPSKSKEIKDVKKSNNIEKYGVEHTSMLDSVKNLIKNTKKERYGDENYNNSCKLKETFSNFSEHKWNTIKNKIKLTKLERYSNENYNNIETICHPIGDSHSIGEKDMLKFIKLFYRGEVVNSYRDGLEIDIYLPEIKLGFEFNGLYWHSDKYKEKNYHIKKTDYFKVRGIRIVHIWEDDWTNKNDIIKSQIINLINLTPVRIFARKCKVVELKSVGEFLNNNHIQGADRSNIKLGLVFNGELVSVMTFNRLEGRKKMNDGEWNLSRFCNKLNTNVIGGASKLIKYFIENKKPKRIISYADKDWSIGGLYIKLGFNKVYETSIDYKYLINGKRKHKQNFKKKNLKISSGTESEYMSENRIFRIWDCGKIKFERIF